jgi:hypothetical protein
MLIGVFTPITRLIYGDMSTPGSVLWIALSLLGCFSLGLALHFVATTLLGRLSQ